MKIGIFGGSFNPIHNHHVNIAKVTQSSLQLDEIWFVPVFNPVHKQEQELLAYKARRELMASIINKFPNFKLSDTEMELGGPSYTVRTVDYLQQKFPENSFTLIIGGDSLEELSSWREANRLVKLLPIAAIGRPGFTHKCTLPEANITLVSIEENDISGTTIRDSLTKYKFDHIDIPRQVLRLILKNNYYNSLGKFYTTLADKIRNKISELAPGLQTHIYNVADLCIEYCLDLETDPRMGFVAGLSHDLFRAANAGQILELSNCGGHRLLELEQRIPMLAHGAAAATYLKQIEPSVDIAILEAIRWHTLLKEKPSKLLMALAMADTLELGRKDEVRSKIFKSKVSATERYKLVCDFKKNHRRKKASNDINIK